MPLDYVREKYNLLQPITVEADIFFPKSYSIWNSKDEMTLTSPTPNSCRQWVWKERRRAQTGLQEKNTRGWGEMWLPNDTPSLTIGLAKAPGGQGVDIAAATDWPLFRQPVQFQWCADNPAAFGRSQSHAVRQHEPKPHGVLPLLIKSCLDCTSAVGPMLRSQCLQPRAGIFCWDVYVPAAGA